MLVDLEMSSNIIVAKNYPIDADENRCPAKLQKMLNKSIQYPCINLTSLLFE